MESLLHRCRVRELRGSALGRPHRCRLRRRAQPLQSAGCRPDIAVALPRGYPGVRRPVSVSDRVAREKACGGPCTASGAEGYAAGRWASALSDLTVVLGLERS